MHFAFVAHVTHWVLVYPGASRCYNDIFFTGVAFAKQKDDVGFCFYLADCRNY